MSDRPSREGRVFWSNAGCPGGEPSAAHGVFGRADSCGEARSPIPAYYRRTLREFLRESEDRIVSVLAMETGKAGFAPPPVTQVSAWRQEIGLLRRWAERACLAQDARSWQILLEFPIPRRGKRIDAVVIGGRVLVVLEFKCGAGSYSGAALAQVENYALDLRDFHQESSGRPIVPMLIATRAPAAPLPERTREDWVKPTVLANADNFATRLSECIARDDPGKRPPLVPSRWDRSGYSPTPTIIEAAQALYAGQNVREISRSHAGVENLTRTTDAVIRAIEQAAATRRKRICFITGVPGAGKTLAGLNIVHNRGLHRGDLGVFLSGNGPLVRVLREALTRDGADRLGQTVPGTRRQVETFVQNVHRFIDLYFANPEQVPVDRVVVFDEAQRAWDAAQSAKKFNRAFSEPELLLEIMDRHPDWSVIVALVGGGQEIIRGEAGLAEWGRALSCRFPHWEVSISPELKAGNHATGACLFPAPPEGIVVTEEPSLHLSVNLRSFKAELLSELIDAILNHEPDRARELAGRLGDFRLGLTREFERAKRWLRHHRRGLRRAGLVASSGARRLRAHGLDVTAELDVENWFLSGPDDVRSSDYLEVPATEFGIQGLELDWAGVCWGGDLTVDGSGWNCRAFRGTKWQQVRDDVTRRYIINKYRVLLTRAREGTVIWVPPGDPGDATRPPEIYDEVAAYLSRCGIETLTPSA